MTDKRPSPPDLEAWLDAAYPSSQKGGTLIEPAVRELETHEAWMRAPGRYRPAGCLSVRRDAVDGHRDPQESDPAAAM